MTNQDNGASVGPGSCPTGQAAARLDAPRFDPSRIRDFDLIATTWDRVRTAINQVDCALPRQMSEAASSLGSARAEMDATLRKVGLRIAGRDTDGSPKGTDPQGLDGEAATAGAGTASHND